MTDNQRAGKSAAKIDERKLEQEASWIGARLREPSTYAGLAALLGLIGLDGGAADLVKNISMIGMGIGGLIAIVLPEAKRIGS